jgi:hypothetical protein
MALLLAFPRSPLCVMSFGAQCGPAAPALIDGSGKSGCLPWGQVAGIAGRRALVRPAVSLPVA